MSYFEDECACGLDLGTTFSCIGVYKDGGVEIIPNKNEERMTPSLITIIDKKTILRGEEAIDHLVKDYDSSIYDIKRFIGRDINDEEVKKEIKKENFPFKIKNDEINKYPVVEINKNNEKITFSFEEISSLIIRKMVESAQNYLNKKVSKLVITVPANFNDAQRICTKQAAKIAGIQVLRIINEPTAAALAYGLQDKMRDNKGKILVFDLGGGTFDVTILNISENNSEHIFDIISTNGDKYLGGEDFDNKLVEYFLNRFCNKYEELNQVKKDKKAIRKLKIACEKIKRVLSSISQTTLTLNNFYDNKDMVEIISRFQFNEMCKDLIEKLEKPLEEALIDAKITANDISEIVLVGGSTKMPMIKSFISNFFKNSKINNSINPDEAVAYGATLMAAKILKVKDNFISSFNLMDITPLSLGIEVINNNKDKKIKKQGGKMSVIIKRGAKLPYVNSRIYTTTENNQPDASIIIYEGEKKYVKYNHILGEVTLSRLPKKPKGEVKIDVKFFIDVNGILTVTGKEIEENENNSIEIKIKNDKVKLSEEQIEKLKKKIYIHPSLNSLDYSNIKELLRECEEAYKEYKNDEEKFNILMSYNYTLEEFIDSFDKDFDNETMIEKYHIYVKDLFVSYSNILKMENQIQKNDEKIKNNIINKVKLYINIFTNKSFGYLTDLVEIIKDFPENIFYEIIIFIIEKSNEYGQKYLTDIQKYSKYNSIIYFEKSISYFENYISSYKNLNVCNEDIINKCKFQVEKSRKYFDELNSGEILLSQDAIKYEKVIQVIDHSQTKDFSPTFTKQIEYEKYKLILENFEKMLETLKGKENKEEAICLTNIIKLNIRMLGENYKKNLILSEKCETIVKKININPQIGWYQEFLSLHEELKEWYNQLKEYKKKEYQTLKLKYKKKFDEIDNIFNNKKNNLDFIIFILEKYPYPEYDIDKNNNEINLKSQELIKILIKKYQREEYEIKDNDDEIFKLKYCIFDYIEKKLQYYI